MFAKFLLAVATVSAGSCSQFDDAELCRDPIQLAPQGYSNVVIDIAKISDIPDRQLFLKSAACPDTESRAIFSKETRGVIHAWLDQEGLPLGESAKIGEVEITIYKFSSDEREFFVTAFWGRPE